MAFSLVFIVKIGGLLSKFRSSNKKEIKGIKKEIKEETKELGVKVEEVKEQEEKIKQSLVEKESTVETLTEDNSNRKEELKPFLPDLD